VSRYRVALPMLDIHAIGTGGGSIGWLDAAEALHVGPRSAGAVPGPACYGRGGVEPTVTDADLVLGYLSTSLLGGEVTLDRELAAEAIHTRLAEPMGVGVVEAAVGMLRVINNQMNNSVRYVSVARGYDPREFALMAFGGAGAVHAAMQAADLGVAQVLVPKEASVFCALGALTSDLKVSLIHPYYSRGSRASADDLREILAELHERASTTILHAGEAFAEVRGHPYVDARYIGQTHEVTVPLAIGNGVLQDGDVVDAIGNFHQLHEDLYSFKNPEQEVELVNLRYDLVGVREKPERVAIALDRSQDPAAALRGGRDAHFELDGRFQRLETPVFDGERLKPGNVLTGPCIIEEPYTTIVVCPGQTARLNEQLVYEIDVDGHRAGVA
jgi:N-methylhydantoinase A